VYIPPILILFFLVLPEGRVGGEIDKSVARDGLVLPEGKAGGAMGTGEE
jgi:hypothetical protein